MGLAAAKILIVYFSPPLLAPWRLLSLLPVECRRRITSWKFKVSFICFSFSMCIFVGHSTCLLVVIVAAGEMWSFFLNFGISREIYECRLLFDEKSIFHLLPPRIWEPSLHASSTGVQRRRRRQNNNNKIKKELLDRRNVVTMREKRL